MYVCAEQRSKWRLRETCSQGPAKPCGLSPWNRLQYREGTRGMTRQARPIPCSTREGATGQVCVTCPKRRETLLLPRCITRAGTMRPLPAGFNPTSHPLLTSTLSTPLRCFMLRRLNDRMSSSAGTPLPSLLAPSTIPTNPSPPTS